MQVVFIDYQEGQTFQVTQIPTLGGVNKFSIDSKRIWDTHIYMRHIKIGHL